MNVRLVALLSSAVLLSTLGCGSTPSNIGGAIRPDDPRATAALGEKCTSVGERDQPLIVDWNAHDRGDLENAMSEGVAVVHYECGSFRLLRDCKVPGDYSFVGMSRKEQVLQLDDRAELAANLPVGGALLAKELSGSLSQGSGVDLAMVLVGKRRTTLTQLAHDKLVGGDAACAGATHFVRGAYVGAFAMSTSTRGAANTVALVVKANAGSQKLAHYRDGETNKCSAIVPGAARPPEGCSALVRLELVALSGEPPKAERAMSAPPATCPSGLVFADGKCTKASKTKAYQCKSDDPIECFNQCEKGYGPSCTSLGVMHATGEAVPRDDTKAARYFKKACDGEDLAGCSGLAVLTGSGRGVAKDEKTAVSLLKRACDGGEVLGCLNLGVQYAEGNGVPRDWATANALFKNACDGGSAAGCYSLGVMINSGRGAPADQLHAIALWKRACDGNYLSACNNLAAMYAEGQGIQKDLPRAAGLYEKACAADDASACNNLAWMYKGGSGVPKDLKRATELNEKACKLSEKRAGERDETADGCNDLAAMVDAAEAVGTFPDALSLYKRACIAGSGKACNTIKYRYGMKPPREP